MERSLTHREAPSLPPQESAEQKAALNALFNTYKMQRKELLARGYRNPFQDKAFDETLHNPSNRTSWDAVVPVETPGDAVAILNILREGDARRRSSSEAERHAWRDFAHSMTSALSVFDTASHLPPKDVLSLYGTFLQTDLASLIDDSTLQTLNEAIIERHGEFLEAFSSANPVEKILFSHVVHEMRSRTSQYTSSADRFWTNSFFSSLLNKAKESSVLSYLILKQSPSEHAPEQEDSRSLPIWTHFIDKTSSRSHDDAQIIAKNALGEISEQGVVTAVATIPLNTDLSRAREVPSSAIFTTILRRLEALDPEEDWEDLREWCLQNVQRFLSADERERLNRAWDDLSQDVRPLQQEFVRLQRHFGYTPVHFSPVDEVAVNNRKPLKEHERIGLQNLHRPAIKAPLEQALGIPLQDLSLREQASFLGFLIKTDKQAFDQTAKIIHTHGIHAAQTFLACEQGAKHGEQILAFAQTAPKEVASRVFAKFADIANLVDTSAQDLASQFLRSSENDTAIDAEDVRRELIKRGARILTEAHTLIQKDPSGDSLLARLERYKADTELFIATWKANAKKHIPSFEALKACQIRSYRSAELSEDLRAKKDQEYTLFMQEAWAGAPKSSASLAIEGARAGLRNTNTDFFELTLQDQLVAMIRFDQRTDLPSFHVGSFATHPKLQETGIALAFCGELLQKISDRSKAPLTAHCITTNPAISTYLHQFAFVITGIEHTTTDSNSLAVHSYTLQKDSETVYKPISRCVAPIDTPSAITNWIRRETSKGRVITQYTVDQKTRTARLISAERVVTKAHQPSKALRTETVAARP